jgi:hypothetical protein
MVRCVVEQGHPAPGSARAPGGACTQVARGRAPGTGLGGGGNFWPERRTAASFWDRRSAAQQPRWARFSSGLESCQFRSGWGILIPLGASPHRCGAGSSRCASWEHCSCCSQPTACILDIRDDQTLPPSVCSSIPVHAIYSRGCTICVCAAHQFLI